MTERSRFWKTVGSPGGDDDTISREIWWQVLKGIFHHYQDPNVGGIVPGTGVGGFGPTQVTEDSPAGTDVIVHEGQGFVDGTWYETDAEVPFTITANSSGNSRIDTVILRKTYATATQTVRLVVLEGTPSGSPVPPTLTQNTTIWEYPLADILVPDSFTTIPDANITDRRTPAPAANNIIELQVFS